MVRFKNNSYFEWIVNFTFLFFLLAFTPTFAQPTECFTPSGSFKIGGDFDIASSPAVSNNHLCIPMGVDSVEVSFIQKLDPAVGSLFAANTVAYIFDVSNTSNFNSGFKTKSKYTLVNDGTYYIAQAGITGGTNYQRCKKLVVHRVQPVIATVLTCGSSVITINIPPKSVEATNNHSRYVINWGDGSPNEIRAVTGSPLVIQKQYVPTSPIFITGEYLDDAGIVICSSDVLIKKPEPSNAIYIDKVEKKANKTDYEIGFKGFRPNVDYNVSYAKAANPSVFTQAAGNYANGTAVVTGLDPAKDYCFKIVYVDNCGVGSQSNVVCSMTLTGDVLSDSDVELEWTTPGQPRNGLQENVLKKDNVNCQTGNCNNDLALASPNARKHVYKQLECSRIFTFQAINKFRVTINGITRNIEVFSNIVTIDPANGPKPPAPINPMAVSYINNKEVYVNIYQLTPKAKYNFYRTVGGTDDYKLIGTRTDNRITDSDVNPDKEYYCYKYSFEDACGRVSELSMPYCTILLNSKSPNTIDWTQYVVPNTQNQTPTIYYVELIDPDTGLVTAIETTDMLRSNVEQIIANTSNSEIKFRIFAVQQAEIPGGVTLDFSSYSNTFTFNLPPTLFVPSAFTPNGDGKNDIFRAESRFVESGLLRVFDRWGGMIFESLDLENGWDGTIGGSGSQKAPAGTYAYKLEATNVKGEITVKTGSVTLIR